VKELTVKLLVTSEDPALRRYAAVVALAGYRETAKASFGCITGEA
jgi:hypothetical protein